MVPARRASRGDGIARWLLPASVLHVAIVLAASLSPWARPAPERAAAQPRSLEPESSVELTLLDDGEWPVASRAAPSLAPAFETAPAPASDEPPDATPLDPGRIGTAQPVATASLDLARGASPSLPESDEPPAPEAAAETPRAAAPTLSLEQLGVGDNPFLDVRVEPLTKAEQANARLQAALHPSSIERDHQRSLGPAGPVVDAARNLVLADDGLVETSAVLNVRVDAAGHVTEVHVLEASSQINAWQLIAARLAKALNPVTLRAAQSNQGWGLKLRLASSVRLPSGAAPGLRMGVLGEQVAGSGGPGSTSLELSPTSKLDIKGPIDDAASERSTRSRGW
jgi:hypothetical protein